MEDCDVAERIHALGTAQAVQAAPQVGAVATQMAVQAGTVTTAAAAQAGVVAMVGAGAASLIVGLFLGMTIRSGK